MRNYDILNEQSRWIVGMGNRQFWSDNWVREIIGGPRHVDDKLTILEGLEIINDVWVHIPNHLHESIRRITLHPHQHDKRIYTPNEYGKFSIQQYIDNIRTRGVVRLWSKLIWHKFIPPDFGCLLWKIMRHATAVDKRIQTRGINLSSSCRCCTTHHEETIQHLFIRSEIAQQVWKWFGSWFSLPSSYHSVPHALRIWALGVSPNKRSDVARIATAAYVFKEIRAARCRATLEGTEMSAPMISRELFTESKASV